MKRVKRDGRLFILFHLLLELMFLLEETADEFGKL